jgi:hypothetical protein
MPEEHFTLSPNIHCIIGQTEGKNIDSTNVNIIFQKRESVLMAESQVPNMTQEEWDISARTSVAVTNLEAYDDMSVGEKNINILEPFNSNTVFISGPLLVQREACTDYRRVVDDNNQFDPAQYQIVLEERLLPALLHVNAVAAEAKKKAEIGMTGLGCGFFGGTWRPKTYGGDGTIKTKFYQAVTDILKKNQKLLPNIAQINFNDEKIDTDNIGHIILYKRPGGLQKPAQTDTIFFKFAAWDPASWLGNEYWQGQYNASDDPANPRSTNMLKVITHEEGQYNKIEKRYVMSNGEPYYNNQKVKSIMQWTMNQCGSEKNLFIYKSDGQCISQPTVATIKYQPTIPEKEIDSKDKNQLSKSDLQNLQALKQKSSWRNIFSKSLVRGGGVGLVGMGIYALVTGGLPVGLLAIPIASIILGLMLKQAAPGAHIQ